MRYLLFIFLFVSLGAGAQVYQNQSAPMQFTRGTKHDTILVIPRGCDTTALPVTKYGARTMGAVYFDTCNNVLYARGSYGWVSVATSIDTTQFPDVVDSTGNMTFRILYAQNGRITGTSNMTYDTMLLRLNATNFKAINGLFTTISLDGIPDIVANYNPITDADNLTLVYDQGSGFFKTAQWADVWLNKSDTATMLAPYIRNAYRTPGVDSIYFITGAGNVLAVKDSTGGGAYTAGNGIKIDGSTIRWADTLASETVFYNLSNSNFLYYTGDFATRLSSLNFNKGGDYTSISLASSDASFNSQTLLQINQNEGYFELYDNLQKYNGIYLFPQKLRLSSDSIYLNESSIQASQSKYTPTTTSTAKYKAVLMDSTTGALVTISPDSLGGGGGGSGIDSIRFVNSGVLHTTPAAFALSGSTGVVTQTLATQSAGTIFGNATASSATPTFTASPRIGTDLQVGSTATINSSAVLQLESTTKGFLMPRMTASQRTAISTPATGLQVYDTDSSSIMYYNGSRWQPLDKRDNIEATISGNVTMTSANTYYSGPSIVLPVGTWDVQARASFLCNASGNTEIQLWDGTNLLSGVTVPFTSGRVAGGALSDIITVTSGTLTITLRAYANTAGNTMYQNTPLTSTPNATYIKAVRIR